MSLRVWYAGMCPPSAALRRRKRKRRGFCVFPSFLHPDWFTLSPTAHERRPGNSTETFVFLPDVFTRASCVTLPCCPRVWSGLAWCVSSRALWARLSLCSCCRSVSPALLVRRRASSHQCITALTDTLACFTAKKEVEMSLFVPAHSWHCLLRCNLFRLN